MNYYYINTEATAFKGCSPHNQWIARRHAFTSGDYEKYGVQKLGRLDRGDICFMYAKWIGIVASGQVCERWDGRSYEGEGRWIYNECDAKYIEYRIGVDWHLQFVNNPIRIEEIRLVFRWLYPYWGWRRALDSIEEHEALELLSLVQERSR